LKNDFLSKLTYLGWERSVKGRQNIELIISLEQEKEKSKIDKLKEAIQSRFNIATVDFIAVWRDVKERLNNKCKDTRRKHAKIVK